MKITMLWLPLILAVYSPSAISRSNVTLCNSKNNDVKVAAVWDGINTFVPDTKSVGFFDVKAGMCHTIFYSITTHARLYLSAYELVKGNSKNPTETNFLLYNERKSTFFCVKENAPYRISANSLKELQNCPDNEKRYFNIYREISPNQNLKLNFR